MMQATLFRITACAVPFVLWAAPALAYVGPGAGITLLGALWGVLIAIGAALAFVLLWPLRRMLFGRRSRHAAARAPEGNATEPMTTAKSGR